MKFEDFKIIGGTDEQRENARTKLSQERNKTGQEIWGDDLLKVTDIEKLIIEDCVEYANGVAQKFGADIKISPEQFFVLKQGAIAKDSPRFKDGHALASKNSLTAGIERLETHRAVFEVAVVHEAFHLLEAFAERIDKDGNAYPYRSGISMMEFDFESDDYLVIYFGDIQEAVVAELTGRYIKEKIASNPVYREDMEMTEFVKNWLASFLDRQKQKETLHDEKKSQSLVDNIFILPYEQRVLDVLNDPAKSDGHKVGYLRGYYDEYIYSDHLGLRERIIEREKFGEFCNELISASNGMYQNKDQIVDDFAQAQFTGKYLPLAHKIEASLGKGSFRRIAERFKVIYSKKDNEINQDTSK